MPKIAENKTKRVEIRLTEKELKYLKFAAYSMGQNVSKTISQYVNILVNGIDLKLKKGELSLADIEAVCND